MVGEDARRSAAARGSQKPPSRCCAEEATSSTVAFTRLSGSDTRRASRVPSVPDAAAAAAVPIPRHRRRRAAACAIGCSAVAAGSFASSGDWGISPLWRGFRRGSNSCGSGKIMTYSVKLKPFYKVFDKVNVIVAALYFVGDQNVT